MSSQPPYGNPPPGDYQGGGYPPPGGYPPQGPPPSKTQTLNFDYNVAAMLCYIPTCFCFANVIASILWLATEPKQNRFVRFHSIQGLLLVGIGVVLGVVLRIAQAILGAGVSQTGSAGLACGGATLLLVLNLGIGVFLLVLHIIGMVKAYQNQMWKIPFIGDIAEKNS
ncbi:MAG: DUF4870 domain-containing protein [Blastocatellia bacterium]|nr:DUF4870 domain-containing protein [Blastocatellia bacterium]